MTRELRLGTRGSQLAVAQSQQVADSIREATGVPVTLLTIRTKGDRIVDRPLSLVGGKGLFTKEVEEAVLNGQVDFAVHSMKDLPTDMPEGLCLGAVPLREDPRDALICGVPGRLREGAVVGTGSARRAAQLRGWRADLQIKGIRGNVDTRIEKLRSGEYDAIVLAAAGLNRLGRQDEVSEFFSVKEMIPAVGQGALALQCRKGDRRVLELLASVHHVETARCIRAERSFLRAISGGCSVPAACHAEWRRDGLFVMSMYAPDGGRLAADARWCDYDAGEQAGEAAARHLFGASQKDV